MGNTQKAATLGMPHGTANNRLRKSIMFKYVKMAEENYCYRCGAEIESVNDISIEHKEPWEGVNADLFFDLDNISFSHRSCNSGARRDCGGLGRYPDGSWKCYTCGCIKKKDEFHVDKSSASGVSSKCRECKKLADSTRSHIKKHGGIG